MTGVARGIGAAIAGAFAAEGAAATVIATDIADPTGRATAAVIGATSTRLDVASEADWSRIAARHPTCDIVVNNAGTTGLEPRAAAPLPLLDPKHAASPTDKRCTR